MFLISKDPEISVVAHQPGGLDISLTYDSSETYSPPTWMALRYREAVASWTARLSFESVRARPCRIWLTEKGVRLAGGPMSYSQTRALHDCIQAYREGAFGGARLNEAVNISSASLVVSMMTDDGLMLLPRRSPDVVTMPGLWAAGLGEGLEPVDFESGSLHAKVRRTLHEELAIEGGSVPESAIKTLGVFQNTGSLSLTIFSVVDLVGAGEEFSSTRVAQRATFAKDAWEHSELRFVEPDLEALEGIVASSGAGLCHGVRTCMAMLKAYLATK
jgi:hypothetical protein